MADRRVSVGVDADVAPFVRGLATATAATKGFARELESTDHRLSGVVQGAMALTPALVPLGAVGVPMVAGLTAQLGAAAGAVTVALMAFNGLGDALGAVSDYRIDPSVANLQKMEQALHELGPAGADFVLFLDTVRPKIDALQNTAREGLFPGAEEGITELLDLMPEFDRIVGNISTTLGNLTAEAGDNLNDPRWVEFFDYIADEAGPTLDAMGRTLGNVTEGLVEMMMAADPMSDDFTKGMLEASRAFREWADGLEDSEGFMEFMDYIRDVRPQVADTLGAVANALVSVVTAAAPVGKVVLPGIEALAKMLSAIADSPAGPVLIGTAAGIGALSRAVALYNAANGSAIAGFLGKAGKDGQKAGLGLRHAAAGAGILTASLTDLDDSLGVSNTVMFGLMGTMAGPWGAAAGAAVGAVMDLTAANDDLEAAMRRGQAAMETGDVDAMRDAIASLKAEMDEFDINPTNDLWSRLEIAALEQEIRELEHGVGGLGSVFGSALAPQVGSTADAFDAATLSAQDFMASLDQVNARLDKRSSLRAYRDSLREFAVTMGEAPAQVRKGTAAWDVMEESLDQIAESSLTAASHLRGMGRLDFLDKARAQFIKAARDMDIPKKRAEQLADAFGLLDKVDPTIEVTEKGANRTAAQVDKVKEKADDLAAAPSILDLLANDQATPYIDAVRGNLSTLDGDQATVTITTIRTDRQDAIQQGARNLFGFENADGRVVDYFAAGGMRENHVAQIAPAGAWRVWAEDETGGEAYIPLSPTKRPRSRQIASETVARLGGSVEWYADGGLNVDQRLDVLRLQQQINELRRDLAADGKDSIKGLARAIAEAELEAAKRDLRQARRAPGIERRDALRSVELDIEGGASVEDTREALREFRKDVREAGGTWTKALANQSHRLIDLAKRQERAAGNLERETELRDRIAEKLEDEIRALEEVKSAMASFSSSVAGNFLSDPFGGAYTASGSAGPAAPVNDPALSAARAALSGAEGRYQSILASGGDRLSRSYEASKALAEVAQYRSQVDELERTTQATVEAQERTVSGLDAFRETLLRDTEAAQSFYTSLSGLSGILDAGLFQQLALSGDYGTAAQIAGLDRGQLSELNLIWQEREAAAAQVATFATQQAFGAQLDAATRAVELTEKTLARQDRTIERLNNRLENLGNRVEAGAERGVASLGRQIQAIQAAINNLPRETAAQKRKAGKR